MCEPATLIAMGMSASAAATTSAVVLGGTAALGAYGAYNRAKAAQNQASYAAKVADINAGIAEGQALDATKRGDEEASKARREAEQLKGVQRNRMAASGLDLAEGTAVELVDQTEFFSLTDQTTIKNNASREAWNKRNQGRQFSSDAGMERATARSISPGMAATTSLLGSAPKVADAWYSR